MRQIPVWGTAGRTSGPGTGPAPGVASGAERQPRVRRTGQIAHVTELESGQPRVVRIERRVADVQHALAVEVRRALQEAMLVTREVHRDARLLPDRPLLGKRAVGRAPDDISARLYVRHLGEGDGAPRVARLQRAVDVEADQDQPGRGISHGAGPTASVLGDC